MTTKVSSSVIGDRTIGPTQLANTAITAGTYGGTTQIPYVTIDAQGRATAAGNVSLSVANTNLSATGTANSTTFLRGDNTWSGISTSQLSATGTANSTTFLRGDNTWTVVSSASLGLGTTNNVQFNSLGVGTAASGTTGEIRAANDITGFYTSDIKFKEHVNPIEDALAKVITIGGKTYDWKDDYLQSRGGVDGYFVRKEDFGVIAQDVQSVFPLAVRQKPDGSLAVDYEKLCALAFQAIVELKAKVDELEHKIR